MNQNMTLSLSYECNEKDQGEFNYNYSYAVCCSSSHFSASIAAWQPEPAAVIACLYRLSATSPIT